MREKKPLDIIAESNLQEVYKLSRCKFLKNYYDLIL